MIHVAMLLTLLTALAEPVPGNLAGTVVDTAKKPIPHATVFIHTAKPRVGIGTLCPGCYVDCGKKATTDDDGKFQISGLAPDLLFQVLVAADGFRPKFAKNVDPQRGPLDVKLKPTPSDLSQHAVLQGRVLGPSGKPVVGAIVRPLGCERIDRRWGGRMPGVDPMSVTNSRGEFLITGNPGDLGYDLEVKAQGLANLRVDLLPTGKNKHEIRMTQGAAVQGRILKDGKPVPGIAVGLVQCNTDARTFVGTYRVGTDADGRYRLVHVHPNDQYSVFTTMRDASRLNGIMPPQRIAVGADGTTAEVGDSTLSLPVHRVAGRVMLTDDKPIPAGTQLLLSREALGTWDSQRVAIAADGSFVFKGVPEEVVELSTRIPGYRLASNRNRFQQTQPWAVAMFVDGDRSGLKLYLEPDPASTTHTDKK